jgi:hypothetical protein
VRHCVRIQRLARQVEPGVITAKHIARIGAAAALCGLVLAAGGPGPARAATTAPALATVSLQGEGSWDPIGEMTTWQNDLYGQSGAINLNYLANGGYTGRQDFVAGNLDYVISGVPFQPSELATLKGGAAAIIDAPVMVSALGLLLRPPHLTNGITSGFGLIRTGCDPNNPPDVVPPPFDSSCLDRVPYTGPVNLPAENAAAMLLGVRGNGSVALNEWDNPAIVAAFGLSLAQGSDFVPPAFVPVAIPDVYLRSDPSETDYYAQQFVQVAAPTIWAAAQADTHATFGAVTERLPAVLSVQSRPGVDSQVDTFGSVGTGTGEGEIVPVPPWTLDFVTTSNPGVPVEWVQLQNASGQWEMPTPTSIDAAVDAGGDSPLYALTNPVSGAYPLVWVDHLYAPAHGLSMAKTEALATVIRYLATAGQAATTPVGDGQLSAPLVQQALAAANQLVLSNCVGSGEMVQTSSDPGVYAPAALATQNLGPMLHCVAVPPPTATSTTTVAPGTATTFATIPATASTGSSDLFSGGASSAGSTPASGSTGQAPPETPLTNNPPAKTPSSGAVLVASLPLPMPATGAGEFDRLTAFVLGAALYLLAKPPIRRLVRLLRR